jgi:DNA-binding transcriptional LysR family regulator
LKMMALEGRGVVFLPESAATRELKQKQLAHADGGVPEWEVNMEIRLYRERPTMQRPGKPLVSRVWDHLALKNELITKGAARERKAGGETENAEQ